MQRRLKKRMAIARRRSLDALYTSAYQQYERGRMRSALRLFLEGAKRGDPNAQNMVGYFFDTGTGTKRTRHEAMRWYKRAYSHGSRVAASNIGTIYRDEGNFRWALYWFRRAVQLRDADANLEIANLLLARNDCDEGAVPFLVRAIKAKSTDVTEDSRERARQLLKRFR